MLQNGEALLSENHTVVIYNTKGICVIDAIALTSKLECFVRCKFH